TSHAASIISGPAWVVTLGPFATARTGNPRRFRTERTGGKTPRNLVAPRTLVPEAREFSRAPGCGCMLGSQSGIMGRVKDQSASPAVPEQSPRRSSFFSKVRRGLVMTHTEMLEKLGTAVKKGLGFDESALESLEEILLEADVGAETAAALADAVRARTSPTSRTDLEGLRRILIEEIERLIRTAPSLPPTPNVPLRVVFLVGVNGSGKTTTTAKLAAREKAEGRTILLAAADTFRAGAIEQLSIWGERLQLPVIRHREGADPSAVLFDAIAAAKARGVGTLFVDTA